MMKISLAILALAAATASAFDATTGKYGELDTSRAPRFFDQPKARKAGYSYEDEWSVSVRAEMDSGGLSFKGDFEGKADTKMKVTEMSGGSIKIELGIENVKADLTSFIMSLHCDSNDQTHSDAECEEVLAAVGQTETLVMDKDGNLLEVTTPDGQTINVAAIEPMTLNSQFQANKVAAAHHFDKSQQLLKLIPDHAVRPGDSWIDDVDMGGMGTFKGNSYLKGYTNYQGADCALFYFEGTLHLDISHIAQAIGADPAELPTNMADAKITNDMLWDVNDEIARWMQVNITTSFDMPNPMDPTSDQTVHVPFDVVMSLATDITERAANEEKAGESAPTSTVAYSSSSSQSSSSKSSGGGGGAFKGIFFAILVGLAAAAGFMGYKKYKEQQEFVRPSYEFSPVGNEPIYDSPPLV